MKLIKKLSSLLLVLLILLSLVACNSNNETTTTEKDTNKPQEQEVIKQEETKQEEVTTTEQVEVVEEVKEEVETTTVKDNTQYSYWVNFLNYDGSVISRVAYPYGETPVIPTNVTYSNGSDIFTFLGFDKKVSPVTMTQTYKALYDVIYVPTENSEPTTNNNNTGESYANISLFSNSFGFVIDYENSTLKLKAGDTWSHAFESNENNKLVLKSDSYGLSFEFTLKKFDNSDMDDYFSVGNIASEYVGKNFIGLLSDDGPNALFATEDNILPIRNNFDKLYIFEENTVPNEISIFLCIG